MTIRAQYDADLAALKTAVAEMGGCAADAVEAALEALCTADADAAAAVIKGDGRINSMQRDIEHRCMTLLLRQQPVAGDLRRISTAMKTVTDIERIGDHAADIAEIIPHLAASRKAGDPAVSDAIRMGQKAHKMLLDALDALTGEDEPAAQKVIAADDEVDYDFNAIKRTLAAEIAADPAKVDAALDLLMVIKYLERIGDHAVNLAEWVEFLRTGRYQNEAMF
ncbi:MAG: phosphate signaling complex protein PhoU [Faecalibacterium sp.]|jgi:phosphate transport system protein|uniref:phosphate signaling complex protein PhoU n=1 Tax=Faecalibacterium sp. TaxID=1971605 RepID=UPI003A45F80D